MIQVASLGDRYLSDLGWSYVFLSWRNGENWADLPSRCTFLFQLVTEATQTAALEWGICVLAGSSKVKWISLWVGAQALLLFCSEPLIENQLLWDTSNKVLAESSRYFHLSSDGSVHPLLSAIWHPGVVEQTCMQLSRSHKADRPSWKRTKQTFSHLALGQSKQS